MAEQEIIDVLQPGSLRYSEAWDLQKKLFAEVTEQRDRHYFILTEHPAVVTSGRNTQLKHLLATPEFLQKKGVDYFETDRGGDVTFHGPGQIVGYPILNLLRFKKDVHWYMRSLEQVIIDTLVDFDITAQRVEGMTGVWVGNNKICAMGVKITRWATMHGFALNVSTNLDYFNYIVPCGIQGRGVTSMSKLLNSEPDEKSVTASLIEHFEQVFSVKTRAAAVAVNRESELYFETT